MTLRLLPAVLSGGSGTRLWPLSTDDAPKQFHALCSERTMLADTLARFLVSDELIETLPPIVVGNQRHGALIQEQAAELGAALAAVVLEPFGRNSAPAAAIVARLARAQDPGALVILMAADALIPDGAGFRRTVAASANAARSHIVVFGVQPTGPETGFGYIESGDIIDGAVRRITRFAEKPDPATAEGYVAGGRHLWNAGIFLFSPQVLLAEFDRLAPEVLAAADAALERATRDGSVIHLDAAAFGACPSISLDYAVMEKTDRAAIMPIGVEWADVGSWSELWRQGPRDGRGNLAKGDALLIDADDSLVWSTNLTVGVVGIKDLIVVQTEEAVLVLPKSRAQDVKQIVEQLKAKRPKESS